MSEYGGTDNLEVMAEAVNYNRFLLDMVRSQLSSGDRALDIGAGIGTFAQALSEDGRDVTCFEPDASQRAHIESLGLPAIHNLDDVESSSFDLAYSINVLEHIDDDMGALAKWHDLIKPGGRLVIYVPAFQILFSGMDRKVGHFRRYRKNELQRKVESAGFDVLRTRYADSLGFFATLAYKMIGNGSGEINMRALVAYDRYVFPLSKLMDVPLGGILGKNVVLLARRP